MNIADNKVISIHYTLSNTQGKVLDKSEAEHPLVYIQGANNIIPGLEQALNAKAVTDKINVTIAPEQAYGVRDEQMINVVQRSMFTGDMKVEEGMQFQADGNTGPVIVTVTKIDGDEITVDGNHPLAGETLVFDVEVVDIREATADELEHGHVHGAGCNHG
jgi:FKBP-type peptidyl-prolyl cis-trans isomerase SlyD